MAVWEPLPFCSCLWAGAFPYLCRRPSSIWHALQFDLPVFSSDEEVALYYFRRFRGHKDCESRESRPDLALSREPGTRLTLVPRIVFQHHRKYIQRVVSCKKRTQRNVTSSCEGRNETGFPDIPDDEVYLDLRWHPAVSSQAGMRRRASHRHNSDQWRILERKKATLKLYLMTYFGPAKEKVLRAGFFLK